MRGVGVEALDVVEDGGVGGRVGLRRAGRSRARRSRCAGRSRAPAPGRGRSRASCLSFASMPLVAGGGRVGERGDLLEPDRLDEEVAQVVVGRRLGARRAPGAGAGGGVERRRRRRRHGGARRVVCAGSRSLLVGAGRGGRGWSWSRSCWWSSRRRGLERLLASPPVTNASGAWSSPKRPRIAASSAATWARKPIVVARILGGREQAGALAVGGDRGVGRGLGRRRGRCRRRRSSRRRCGWLAPSRPSSCWRSDEASLAAR